MSVTTPVMDIVEPAVMFVDDAFIVIAPAAAGETFIVTLFEFTTISNILKFSKFLKLSLHCGCGWP